ncbi:MAG: FAD-dependent oxidoreductase [Clostridia bacterium]|nr:FAD-dependent oxidoreductase [Clostridia bacterium]
MYDVVIIGAGPAGMTAALYTLRAGKTALLIESSGFGGQIVYSNSVENYPAVKKQSGMEFADALTEQVISLGAEISLDKATGITKEPDGFCVQCEGESYKAKSVIIAAGVHHRKLGIEGEEALIGGGISFCAVCDGAFFKNKKVAVVGGGNTAVQDAIYLSAGCEKVWLIHRRDAFRAEKALCEQAAKKENIEFVLNSNVTAVTGSGSLESVTVTDKEGNTRVLDAAGLFVAIGQIPGNQAFGDIVELDESGYIIAGEDCRTNCDGIFVAGDCRTKSVRQLTTAVADGAVAAIAACEYIDKN